MDANAYLKKLGWKGSGHSLDHQGRGIRKPLLIAHKQDQLGLGTKKAAHKTDDQWWLRAFDASLKTIGTGEESTLSQIRKNGINRGGLYGFFVRGEDLEGTISPTDESSAAETALDSSAAPSRRSTPATSASDDCTSIDSSDSDTRKASKKRKRREEDFRQCEPDKTEQPQKKRKSSEREEQAASRTKAHSNGPSGDKDLKAIGRKDKKARKKTAESDAADTPSPTANQDPSNNNTKPKKAPKVSLKVQRRLSKESRRLAKQARRAASRASQQNPPSSTSAPVPPLQQPLPPFSASPPPLPATRDEFTDPSADFIALEPAPLKKIPGVGRVSAYPSKSAKRATKIAAQAASAGLSVPEYTQKLDLEKYSEKIKEKMQKLGKRGRRRYEEQAERKGVGVEEYVLGRLRKKDGGLEGKKEGKKVVSKGERRREGKEKRARKREEKKGRSGGRKVRRGVEGDV